MEVIKASTESKSVSESEPSKDFREEGELLWIMLRRGMYVFCVIWLLI